jgi:DNA-binding NarL/FixJ family response regulator
MSIPVVIADDQELVRAGFQMMLDAQPDIEVVGLASDGVEAISLVEQLQPAVALIDIRMPRLDGLEATRRIMTRRRAPNTRVLIVTTFDLDEYVYDALQAGASGFILKDVTPEQLALGVRMITRGDTLLSPTITRRLIEEFTAARTAAPPLPGADQLTEREHEVWLLVARGMSNQEIADHLVVAETTVKTHVAHILAKLGLRDRVQAVVAAYEAGVITRGAQEARREQ